MIEIFVQWPGRRLQTAPARIILKSHRSRHTAAFRQSLFSRIARLPVSGEICAGFPSPAEEELRGHISFDEYLVARPDSSFLLAVTGDSMAGAGIMDKDWVIIEKGRQPKNGDIVLAEVDGLWTMKYFRKKGKLITLESAGSEDPAIVPREALRIAGVVTALVRKYHR